MAGVTPRGVRVSALLQWFCKTFLFVVISLTAYQTEAAADRVMCESKTNSVFDIENAGVNKISIYAEARAGPRGYIHAATEMESLPQSYRSNDNSDGDKPSRECRELCRINSELARILGKPPFISTLIFLFVAGAIVHGGFCLYYGGRRFAGTSVVFAGLALALSDGFATIGQGPLGWIAWIGG